MLFAVKSIVVETGVSIYTGFYGNHPTFVKKGILSYYFLYVASFFI